MKKKKKNKKKTKKKQDEEKLKKKPHEKMDMFQMRSQTIKMKKILYRKEREGDRE